MGRKTEMQPSIRNRKQRQQRISDYTKDAQEKKLTVTDIQTFYLIQTVVLFGNKHPLL